MKSFSRLYLSLTSATYMVVATYFLGVALAGEGLPVVVPGSDAAPEVHRQFLLLVGFPFATVFALFGAWMVHGRQRYRLALSLAAVPWIYGLGLVLA